MNRHCFWLTEDQFSRLAPLLPTNTRGKPRVDDRRVISGIVHVLKSGSRWIDARDISGPDKTLYNRFVRWAAKGVWVDIFDILASAGGPPAQVLIDSSAVKARIAAHLAAKRMARPVRKRLVLAGLNSLHKRIRPSGNAVGQDGNPRVRSS